MEAMVPRMLSPLAVDTLEHLRSNSRLTCRLAGYRLASIPIDDRFDPLIPLYRYPQIFRSATCADSTLMSSLRIEFLQLLLLSRGQEVI